MRLATPLRNSVIIACALQMACADKKEPEMASGTPRVVEVTATYDAGANEHLFSTDVEQLPAGWTTFRLVNEAPVTHFLVLERLPGSMTADSSVSEVVPVFQEAMDLIQDGKAEDGFARLAELPEWFGEVRFMGGPGVISPGGTSQATVYLEPGNYSMECYVKTAEGKFHSTLGMIHGFTVTEETSGAEPPSDATIEMQLSNEGFGIEGEPSPGLHTVAVHFAEDSPPLLGNDVHLVRLGEGTDAEDAAAWMDWSQPTGMVAGQQATAGLEFLGGTHEMPQGSTAYFTVELTPGRYAWVSERPANDPMYHAFEVAAN